MIKVTIFNEYVHEKEQEEIRAVYPEGIHNAIKQGIECDDVTVRTFTLDTVEQITDEVLADTDVIIWWGHKAHHLVPDSVANRVQMAILNGMGAIFLHSGHHSKPFKKLMGTTCNLTWRADGDYELVWVTKPSHPIAQGIDRFIKLDHVETYGEPFDVPEPDQVVFLGSYEGGEAFRSGCCWNRGNGKIFYFQPGHELYPIFYNEEILTVIRNAVRWAKSDYRTPIRCPKANKPLEDKSLC